MSDYHAIVVLGAAIRQGEPSPKLRARLDAAAEAHRAGRAPRIIVTGRGEAGPMQRYLVASGIPVSVIELEEDARSTYDNARLVTALVSKDARLLVVTQAAHLPRSLALFRRCGASVEGLPAGDPFGLYARGRERVAYVLHYLCGWI